MPKQKVKELYTIPSWAPPNNAQPLAEGSLDVKNAKGYGMPMFEEYIWPHISSYFKKQSEVLDVGSGTGRHSKFFSSRVKTATAIDHCGLFLSSLSVLQRQSIQKAFNIYETE